MKMNDGANEVRHSSFPDEIRIDWVAGLLPSAGNRHVALLLETLTSWSF